MQGIYTFKDEETVPAVVERMYGTHGPHTLNGKRLDWLTSVQVLANSSTSTTTQASGSISQEKSGNMLEREPQSSTISNETLAVELTAELIFNDGTSEYVLLRSMEAYHLLLSYVNKAPLTDKELKMEEARAINKSNVNNIKSSGKTDKASRSCLGSIFLYSGVVIGFFVFMFFLVGLSTCNKDIDNNSKILNEKIVSNKIPIHKKNNDKRIKEIISLLRTIPVSEYGKNKKLYEELLTYKPNNKSYRSKVAFYTGKLDLLKKYNGISEKKVNTMRKAIQLYGYRCDTVDNVRPFIMDRGYSIACNHYNYKYEIEDRGGRLAITLL